MQALTTLRTTEQSVSKASSRWPLPGRQRRGGKHETWTTSTRPNSKALKIEL